MYLFQQSKTAQEFPAQLGISEPLGRTRCAGLRPEDAAYSGGTGDARGKHLFRKIAAEKAVKSMISRPFCNLLHRAVYNRAAILDTGIGMSPEARSHVPEPFSRADPSRSPVRQGSACTDEN